LNSASTNWPL